jgi:hypothetical protein
MGPPVLFLFGRIERDPNLDIQGFQIGREHGKIASSGGAHADGIDLGV